MQLEIEEIAAAETSGARKVLGGLLGAWLSPQKGLPRVIRFKQHSDANLHLRKQDCLQHCYSVALLTSLLGPILKKHNPGFDDALLYRAVIQHDYGEGELRRDILLMKKSATTDLEEYRAFEKRIGTLGLDIWFPAREAFLLQFAAENPVCFPPEARATMEYLQKTKPREIIAFKAIERFDYLFYAFEGFIEVGDAILLAQVIINNHLKLDDYARHLPGFNTIWTPEMSAWCKGFIANHPQLLKNSRG